MTSADSILERLRQASGLSQRELGRRARVSNASLVAYAKGRQDPGLGTLRRLADAADCELVIDVRPRLTPPEARTLELHRCVAQKLEEDPERVLAIARGNLEVMRRTAHGHYWRPRLDAWSELIEGPRRNLVRVLVSTDAAARGLRQASPFSGVLSDEERTGAPLCAKGEHAAMKSGLFLDDLRARLVDGGAVRLTRRSSAADWAALIAQELRGARRSEAVAFRALIGLSDDLTAAPKPRRAALCATAPAPCGDKRFDAAIAAVVDYHLSNSRLPVPDWVRTPSRVLTAPWLVSPYIDSDHVPQAFRRHGVIMAASELESV